MATAKLTDIGTEPDKVILVFEITNGEFKHVAQVQVTQDELLGCSTWNQLWTIIQPRIKEISDKFVAQDTRTTILKTKIGVEITL